MMHSLVMRNRCVAGLYFSRHIRQSAICPASHQVIQLEKLVWLTLSDKPHNGNYHISRSASETYQRSGPTFRTIQYSIIFDRCDRSLIIAAPGSICGIWYADNFVPFEFNSYYTKPVHVTQAVRRLLRLSLAEYEDFSISDSFFIANLMISVEIPKSKLLSIGIKFESNHSVHH